MPSVNVDSFIDRVLQRTLLHSEWDQGAMNLEYAENTSAIRILPLKIGPNAKQWGDETTIPPFVTEVWRVGDVHVVANRTSFRAIHVIGKHGLPKFEWLRMAQVYPTSQGRKMLFLEGVWGQVDFDLALTATFALAEQFDRIAVLPRSTKPYHTFLDLQQLRKRGFSTPAAFFGTLFGENDTPQTISRCFYNSFEACIRNNGADLVLITSNAATSTVQIIDERMRETLYNSPIAGVRRAIPARPSARLEHLPPSAVRL